MSEVEFVPTSLESVMGNVADDTPQAEPEPEAAEETPEKVEEEQAPVEPEKVEAKEEPEEKANNFAQLREVTKTQKARIEELEATQKEPAKAPDVFEDQEAYTKHIESSVDNKLLGLSVTMVKEQYEDYDDVEARFIKEAETNPAIIGNVQGKSNMALAVYREGQKLLELDKIGDPVEYRAKIKAEILAELKSEGTDAEVKAKEEKQKLKDSLPDDISSEGSAGNRAKKEVFEPTSLDTIL